MTIKSPALRYHGSKFRLWPWLQQFFPQHHIYTESFGGGAAVLLQKQRSYSEVYNDLDRHIVNFFRVLRDKEQALELERLVRLTPFAREEFEQAFDDVEDPVEQARRVLVRALMGFGSAGATKGQTGFRIDTRRKYGTASNIWARYPDQIALLTTRLQEVIIENRPALEVIKQHDSKDTLHYVDPPYLKEVRNVRGDCYRHEMNRSDHIELLKTLNTMEGMIVVSHYPCDLYKNMLSDWATYTTESRISSSRGTAVKTEQVWINRHCAKRLNYTTLFKLEG